jgi:hypothetical protein
MAGNLGRIAAIVLGGLAVLALSFVITLGLLHLWDRQEQVLQTLILKNSAHRVEISQEISSDSTKARVTDGIALVSGSIVPKDPASTIRIHIRTYAWSDRLGTAMLAVFRDGQEEAVQVFSKPLRSPRVDEMIALFEIPGGATPIGLHVRIGAGDDRPIMLNGNPGGAGLESIVTIHEVKRRNAS